MALLRSSVLYPRNDVTVDTGAGIDVRRLDDTEPGATDTSQTIQNASQGTNLERTFDPATATPTNTFNAATTLAKLGWAVPTTEMDATDARCSVILLAQTVAVNWSGVASGTGTGAVGAEDVYTPRASLWRYDPAANTGTLIAGASGTPVTFDATLAYTNTAYSTSVSISIPLTTFVTGEVWYVQIGGNLACGAGLLGAARTFTVRLDVDVSSTNVDPSGGLRQSCAESAAGALTLDAQRVVRDISLGRADLAGVLTLDAQRVVRAISMGRADLVGALDLNAQRVVRAISLVRPGLTAGLDLAGQRVARQTGLVRAGTLDLAAQRVVRDIGLQRADLAGTLELNGTYARVLTQFRTFTGALDLNAAYNRVIIYGRTFVGTLTLGASWAVCISQTILNRMVSGGTTIIRKIFAISD